MQLFAQSKYPIYFLCPRLQFRWDKARVLEPFRYNPVFFQIREGRDRDLSKVTHRVSSTDQDRSILHLSVVEQPPCKWTRWLGPPVPTTRELDCTPRLEKHSSQGFHQLTSVLSSSLMSTGAAWSPLPVTVPAEVLSTVGKPPPNSGVPKPNMCHW